jgi:hypothetical protein
MIILAILLNFFYGDSPEKRFILLVSVPVDKRLCKYLLYPGTKGFDNTGHTPELPVYIS